MADRPAPEPLARILAETLGFDEVTITGIEPLFGGSVRRHWRIAACAKRPPPSRRFASGPSLPRFTGEGLGSGSLSCEAGEGRGGGLRDDEPLDLVLRADGATSLGIGLELAREFALLQALHAAGLAVPQPVLASCDIAVIGAPFHLTRLLPGSADPSALVAAGPHEVLAERLGAELAALQRIDPSAASCLDAPPADAAAAALAAMHARLDAIGEPRPVAEWALRWLFRHPISPCPPVLCHGDFRTGNYLVADGRFVALLDWEFAHWGDPDEDIAWFCSRCWRFGADAREAGGIASRAAFLRGYAASGRSLDPTRLRWWEVMATLRWLVIALLQRDRCLKQGEASLDLALTGRRAAECEFELLRLTRDEAA